MGKNRWSLFRRRAEGSSADHSLRKGLRSETLEPRVLFSADLPWMSLDAPTAYALQQSYEQVIATTASSIQPAADVAQADRQNLVVVDPSLLDVEQLSEEVVRTHFEPAGYSVVLLDGAESGIDQLAAVLNGDDAVNSIVLLTTADSDGLRFGGAELSVNAVLNNAETISSWRSQFNTASQFQVQAVGLADYADGSHLGDLLNTLTGAEVGLNAYAGLDEVVQPQEELRREVAFVDTGVEGYEALVADLRGSEDNSRTLDVILLDPDRDGVEQISEHLQAYRDLDAIHIVSHGADAEVQLGGITLSSGSLDSYAVALSGWRVALADDADLLIYGCDLAASQSGEVLINLIADLTGADVAASDDITGHQDLGGDWDLEFVVGDVSTEVAFDAQFQDSWNNALNLVPLGGETLVNESTTGDQQTTPNGGGNVAMDASGNYAVTWEDYRGGDADTYLKIFNADGSVRVAEFQVHAANGSAQDWSNVAMTDNGNVVVTWSDNRSGTYETYMRLFDIDGTALTGETLVGTLGGAQDFHSVDTAADGSFVVVFQDALNADIYFQRFNSSGVAQGTNTIVNTTTVDAQNHPHVAVAGNGSFVITWESANSDGSGSGIYAQRFDAAGLAQGSEFRINTTTADEQIRATVDSDADGNFVVAWMSVLQDGDSYGIFGQRFANDGTALGGEFQVNTYTTSDQGSPNIAVNQDGDFIITWHSVGQDGSNFGVYAQRYDSAGAVIGGESKISTTSTNAQGNPTVAYSGAQAVVVWDGNGTQAGQVDSSGVFLQRLDVAIAVASPDLRTTATTDGGFRINADGGNDAYLEADDPDLLAGVSALTFEVEFSTTDTTGENTLVSHSSSSNQSEFFVAIDATGALKIAVQGEVLLSTAIDYRTLRDGDIHTISLTWDNFAGNWEVFVDGSATDSGTGLAVGLTLDGGGALIFGQEQDLAGGGGYDTSQTFSGAYHRARFFDDLRSAQEIAASYRSELQYDETGMLAQWNFDHLSTDGVVTESVSGNNLTIKHTAEAGFTASEATLTFALDENSLDGTVVGSVGGVDAQREARIASLLAADPELRYSAETGKFYKAVSTTGFWSDARTSAESTGLNGVNGQLVTIRSAAENELVRQIAADDVGFDVWIGATDSTVEGEWRWVDGGSEADLFWSGNENGFSPNGAYHNFEAGQPNDVGGNEDVVRLDDVTGVWFDADHDTHDFYGYIVEWDADSVLDATDALTYSIASQSVAGAFEIDADTGEIRVADGTLLDADTLATHTVTVRSTDVESNTYDEAFTISLNNLIEDNNAPTNLSSGIELNTDGGNDAYLVADAGEAILGSLDALTIETSVRFEGTPSENLATLVRYTADESPTGAALIFGVYNDGDLFITIDNIVSRSTVAMPEIFDGGLYQLSVTWDNTNGDVAFYIDGTLIETLTGLHAGLTINDGSGNAELFLGQYVQNEAGTITSELPFHGTFYDVRIWNEVRSEAEISLNYQNKFDSGSLPSGLIANWQMDGVNGSNEVVDVVSGNNLSIGHATGAGFTASTPVEDLHISENANDGVSVGFVVPSDPDSPQDAVSDGLFTEAVTPATWAEYTSGSTLGDWTVVEESVFLHNGDGSYQDPTPLGGNVVHIPAGLDAGVTQTLNTEVGRQYQVVFAASGSWDSADLRQMRVSAGGVSQDVVFDEAPANYDFFTSIVWEHRSLTFTASDTSTDLTFQDITVTAHQGILLADVQVIEIPQAVSAILNNDSTLSYDAATGKFYRYIGDASVWAAAQETASASTINGVGGQLVTVRSAHENEVVRNIAIENNVVSGFWLGATDSDLEGDFRWYQDGQPGDLFYSGVTPLDGFYTNFSSGEPNDWTGSGGQDFVAMTASTGLWDDQGGPGTAPVGNNPFIIEWNASEVLSNFTFSLTDDAGGRFAIDSNTGEVTAADASLIDFETATTHNVDVQVTDATGNTYTETMAITVDNRLDANQTVPGAQSVDEDASLVFSAANGNAVSVDDSVASINSPMQVSLSVNNGILNLFSLTGITIIEGANGSGNLVIDGIESDINNALDGMTFTPDINYSGSVTLNISTDLATGLVGNYTFEGASAGDQSAGIPYDGMFNGNASTAIDGTRGEVLSLDGDGDYVQINSLFENPASVTLASWIKVDAYDSGGSKVMSLGENVLIWLNPGGVDEIAAHYYDGSVWHITQVAGASSPLIGSGWHHIAYTIDDVANTQILYLNGQVIGQTDHTPSIAYTTPNIVTRIGSHAGAIINRDFDGLIDDARVFNRALSDSEIAALATDQPEANDNVAITVNSVNDEPTFDVGPGYTTTDFDGFDDSAQNVVLQSDGKILVGGYSSDGTDYNFAIARYNADGTLDTTFDGDGILTTDFSALDDVGNEIILQSDGKFIVAGSAEVGSYDQIALARYNSDGSLDTSFSGDGKLTTDVGTQDDKARAVTLQDDGKIVVGGYAQGASGTDFLVARYNTDGTLDTTFSGDGIATTDIGGSIDIVTSVRIQDDGKIVASGYANAAGFEYAIVRYNTNGSLDTGFGTSGIVTTSIGTGGDIPYAMEIQPDGKILVGGYATNSDVDFGLARYNTDGSLDTSFGTGGKVSTPISVDTDLAYSLAVLPDGKIVMSGYTANGGDNDLAIVRYNSNGTLDTSFDSDGILTLDLGGADQAYSVAVQPNGKLVVAGATNASGDNDFAILRFNADGTLDGSFNASTALGGTVNFTEGGAAVVLDDDVQVFDEELSGVDDFNGATLTLSRNGGADAEDQLVFDGTNVTVSGPNVSVGGTQVGTYTFTGGELVVTFGGNSTQARVNTLMQNILYSNTSTAPPTSVQIDWTFDDGGDSVQTQGGSALQVSGSTTVDIVDVPNPATLTVPIAQSVDEDTAKTFSTGGGNAIVIDSGSSDNPIVTATLSVTNGTLTLFTTTGITFLNGTGDGDASITISGTESAINTAINGLQYQGDQDYNGADTLTVTTGSDAATETDLYARYEFLDGSLEDETANNYDGTASGDPTLTNDVERGDVMTFDGDDQINVANSVSSLGDEVTIAAWVNLEAGQQDNVFLSIGDVFYIILDNSSSSLSMGVHVNNFTTSSLNSTHNIAGEGWNHIAATINDVTKETRLYLNGQLIRSSSYSFADIDWNAAASANITIGAMSDGSDAFTGSLDDIRIYNSQLNETQIVALMGDQGYANETVAITVNPVNEAPLIDNAGDPTVTTITEDQIDNGGMTVADLLATGVGGDPVTDVDGDPEGIAITSRSNGNGQWQYSIDSGSTWSVVGTVSDSSALLLRASDLVRFNPDGENGITQTFDFRAWDQTTGTQGTKVDTSSNGGTTAFSTAEETATITVADVNDAPILDNSATVTLSTQVEDAGSPVGAVGTLITDLVALGGNVTDVDDGSQTGVAIIDADTSNGTWWYSTDDGSNWNALGGVSDSSARVLNANSNTRIYFQSNADFSGTVSEAITFRAWDRSQGSSGSLQDASTNGGTSSFSSVTDTADITISAVNDAPINTLPVTQTAFEEATTAVTGISISDLDHDGSNLTTRLQVGVGVLNVTLAGSATISVGGDGTSDLTILGTVDDINATLATLTYTGNGDVFGVAADTLTVTTDDQGNTGSGGALQDIASVQIDITNINDAPTGTVLIDNTSPSQGDTLNASNTLADADGLSGPISYQWYRDGAVIAGATSSAYTTAQVDVGAVITAVASYTDDQGTAESVASAATAAVSNVNDAVTGQPTIIGSVTEDQTLTIDTSGISDADGLGTFSYQWNRDGVAIGGATANTYVLSDDDVDSVITVGVSFVDGHGTAESTISNATDTIVNVNDVPTGNVVIDNLSPSQGDTLTVSNTLSDADGLSGTVSYQWFRDGVAVSGATGTSYVTDQTDVGTVITTVASYTDDQGTVESVTSAATAAVANVNDAVAGQPVILGTTTEDQTLTIDTSGISDADGLGTFSYQWNRDGVAISGATADSLTLGDADVGANITVLVSYTDGQGSAESTLSAAVGPIANVNDAPAGSVDIDNLSPSQGDTLAVSNTLSDADGLSGAINYQWYRDGVAVSGATASTYTTAQDDVGTVITAVASYTDDQGNVESVTSAATAAVANVNDAVAGQPVILGTTTEDQTLTIDTSGISDADGLGTFSYQWHRDGVAIDGATADSLTLGDADVGANITVQLSYTDGQGSAESTLSAVVGPVANVNDTPAGSVDIDNLSPSQGETLTVSNTLSDADGLSGAINYQWYRDGVPVSGATGATYTTAQVDVGAVITAVASYTDDQGTVESVTSAVTAAVANVNDAVSGQPVIVGTASEDQTLTIDTSGISDADGLGTFSYQWNRDGVAISGATADSLTLDDADVGANITVLVSYNDGQGSAESTLSAAVGPIANVNDAPTGSVDIDNLSPSQGDTLTVSNTLSDADGLSGTVSYQWFRDGVAVSGVTGTSYVTDQTDVGAVIIAVASYTDDQGTVESVTSAATATVVNVNDAVSGQPVIIGTATEDETLTIDTSGISDADGLGTHSYQWFRDGVAIEGETASALTLGDVDVDASISVEVAYTDGQGAVESVTSAVVGPVTNVNDAPVGSVTIDNLNPAQGETLTAVNTVSDADGLSGPISYQWYRDGVAISGATGSTYTTVQTDVGSAITAIASYTDDQGTAESVTSVSTAAVANVNDVPVVTSGLIFTVLENSSSGTSVGQVTASDIDRSATLDSWAIASGNSSGAFSIDSLTGEIRVADAGALDFETNPAFTLGVTVSDGNATSAMVDVRINLGNLNEAPILGNDQLVTAEDTAFIINGASLFTNDTDPESAPLQLLSISQPANGVVMDRLDGTWRYQPNPDFNGVERISYTVSDGLNETTADIEIVVNSVNDAPEVLMPNVLSIQEGVTDVVDVSVLDVDGDVLTFTLAGGADAEAFELDSTSGALRFSDTPDFEALADANQDNRYELLVTVSDNNGGQTMHALQVELENVNETPTLMPSRMAVDSLNNSEWVGQLDAVDPDTGDSLSFEIVGGDFSPLFAIDAESGELRKADQQIPNGLYQIEVQVTDVAGLSSVATIEVVVGDSIDSNTSVVRDLIPEAVTDDIGSNDQSQIEQPTESQSSPIAQDESRSEQVADTPTDTVDQVVSSDLQVDTHTGVAPDIDTPKFNPVSLPAADETSGDRPSLQRGQPAELSVRLSLSGSDDGVFATVGALAQQFTTVTLPVSPELSDALDALARAALAEDTEVDLRVSGAVVGTVSLSAGFVAWMLRGGSLVASLLSSKPMWTEFDPLPIFSGEAADVDDDHPFKP